MAVPTSTLMMRPLLELATQQSITRRLAEQAMRSHFHLTDEEMALRTPNGHEGLVRNRAGWAMTYLKKAGLLAKVAPATYQTTDAGVAYLKAHDGDITARDLLAIGEFRQLFRAEGSGNPSTPQKLDLATVTRPPAEGVDGAIPATHAGVSQRLLPVDVAMLSPQQMKARRELLGLTEAEVADALLLSVAQVRGVECGSVQPFYNEGFYDRARAKYITLLKTHATKAQTHVVPAAQGRSEAPPPSPSPAPRALLTAVDHD